MKVIHAQFLTIKIPQIVVQIPLRYFFEAMPNALLTEEEVRICELIIRGKANKEIAAALCKSNRAVKFHVSNILKKAKVATRSELQAKCARKVG
jgi:DNA-binding NarL/FixJ family response regulator